MFPNFEILLIGIITFCSGVFLEYLNRQGEARFTNRYIVMIK